MAMKFTDENSDRAFANLDDLERKLSERNESIRNGGISRKDAKPAQNMGATRVEPVRSEDTAREGKTPSSGKRRVGKKKRLELTVSEDVRDELRKASAETGVSISSLLVMSWNMSKHDIWR